LTGSAAAHGGAALARSWHTARAQAGKDCDQPALQQTQNHIAALDSGSRNPVAQVTVRPPQLQHFVGAPIGHLFDAIAVAVGAVPDRWCLAGVSSAWGIGGKGAAQIGGARFPAPP
jgi:hypothetical protein